MKNEDTFRNTDDGIEYINRIQTQYASLSRTQKKIAKFIISHPKEVVHYSITTMAKKVGTVPSSITRFCQALSYNGFSELKVYIDKNLISPTVVNELIQPHDTTDVRLQKLMVSSQSILADTQRTLNPNLVAYTADAILSAKTINLYGQSGGHISCLYAQQMLLRVGILSHVINDSLDMNLAANTLTKDSVAIGIAYSGEIRSVIQALTTAKSRHAKTISITANPNSTMAKISDYVLLYSYNIPDDLQYLHIGSICEIAILGALQTEILSRPSLNANIEQIKSAILTSRRR